VKEYLAFLSRYVPSVNPDDGFAPDTYNWSQLLVRVSGLSINTGPKDYAPIKRVQLTKFEGERWVPLGDPVEGN